MQGTSQKGAPKGGAAPGKGGDAKADKAGEPTEKLLRVGIIHDKRVVEERFIRGTGDVTIGTDGKNVLQLSGSGAPSSLKLFESRGSGRYNLLIERGLDGRIDLGGAPETFHELVESGKAKKRGQTAVVELPDHARGRVVIGPYVVLFQFVDAPPSDRAALTAVLKGGLLYRMDWPYRYILGAVFLVFGGSMLVTHVWWENTGKYYHNMFGSEEEAYAALRVEVKQDKKKKKPETQTVKVEAPAIAAKAPEVADAGKPEDKPKPKSSGARDKDRGGPMDRATRRQKAIESVRAKTIAGQFGTGDGRLVVHEANLASAFEFAEGAAGSPTGEAFAGGPNAVAGGGGGDGGRYKTLSQSDTGGPRLETSTAKTAEKTADSEVKVKANVREGAVSGQEGTGKIDKNSVASVFSRRKKAIQYCYENALRTDQNLKGKVTIRFTIGPAGRITNISATGNTTGNGGVADCIVEKVQGWKFDPPEGGSVTFSYPFLLDTK